MGDVVIVIQILGMPNDDPTTVRPCGDRRMKLIEYGRGVDQPVSPGVSHEKTADQE
jgi:hypothetical protein